jgi:hypothetical protein
VIDVAARHTHVLREPQNGAYHQITAVAFDRPLQPVNLPEVDLVIASLVGLAIG